MEKLKVLFICKDNAIRSQMAAGFLNAYFGERYEAYCCGMGPLEINPQAKKVMEEVGIRYFSDCAKSIEELRDKKFDCIITLCDLAKADLAALPDHRKQLHKSFKDFCIPALCENAGKFKMCFPKDKKSLPKVNEDVPCAFRCLREAICNWVENEMIF